MTTHWMGSTAEWREWRKKINEFKDRKLETAQSKQ